MKTQIHEKVERWPVAKVLVSNRNSRQPQPTDPKVISLAASIKARGQSTPAIGRPHPTKTGFIELGAGARRRVAIQLAGIGVISLIVRKMTDDQLDDLIAVENLQREDPHPREVARIIARRVAAGLKTAKEIAADLGKDEKWVARRMQLLKAIPAILDLWERELPLLSVETVEFIGSLPEDLQEALTHSHVLRHLPSRRALEKHLAERLHRTDNAPFDLNDPRFFVEGCGPGCACDSSKEKTLFDFKDPANGRKKCSHCLNPSCFLSRLAKFRDTQYADLCAGESLPVITRTRGLVIAGQEIEPDYQRSYDLQLKASKGAQKVVAVDENGRLRLAWLPPKNETKAKTPKSAVARKKERVAMLQGKRLLIAREALLKALQGATLRDLKMPLDELIAVVGLPFMESAFPYEANDEVWQRLDNRRKGYPLGRSIQIYHTEFSLKTNQLAKREAALWPAVQHVLTGLMPVPGKVSTTPEFENTYQRISKLIGFDFAAAKRAADLKVPPPKTWGAVDIHTLQPVGK